MPSTNPPSRLSIGEATLAAVEMAVEDRLAEHQEDDGSYSCDAHTIVAYVLTALAEERVRTVDDSFNGFCAYIRSVLDDHYPYDVMRQFDDDPGPLFTLKVREALDHLERHRV